MKTCPVQGPVTVCYESIGENSAEDLWKVWNHLHRSENYSWSKWKVRVRSENGYFVLFLKIWLLIAFLVKQKWFYWVEALCGIEKNMFEIDSEVHWRCAWRCRLIFGQCSVQWIACRVFLEKFPVEKCADVWWMRKKNWIICLRVKASVRKWSCLLVKRRAFS